MPSAPRPIKALTIPRQEIAWLAAAILLGAVLRLGYPGRMAIDHFDEGVYASNFWFGEEQGYAYPARHLYAPPLLPAAIEWTMIIAALCGIRPSGFIPMIPSLIAGLLTIPSLWWVGRRWFGPTAGIVAAWLVAASDLHASYSRAALTDVPVCLFILWGIYFLKQAMESGTWRDLLLASLFTGLAWWTKYNGWLPLAVGLSGGIAWQIFLPRNQRMWGTVLKRWSIVAGLSFLLWSPVLIGLQKQGGYQAVAANHRQYIHGLSQWWPNAIHQGLNAGIYDNIVGIPVEIWAETVDQRMRGQLGGKLLHFNSVKAVQPDITTFASSTLSVFERTVIFPMSRVLLLATPLFLLLGALTGILIRLFRGPEDSQRIGLWFVFAWIAGLCVATPFYQPYPRLILPLHVALWLGAGLLAETIGPRILRAETSWQRFLSSLKLEWSLPAALICCVAIRCLVGSFHAWQDRTELAGTVRSLLKIIHDETEKAGFPRDEAIVYVAGDPPVFFNSKAEGLSLIAPIQNRDQAERGSRPTFVLSRLDAGSDTQSRLNRGKVWSRFRDGSHLVLLDSPTCFEATTHDVLEVERLP